MWLGRRTDDGFGPCRWLKFQRLVTDGCLPAQAEMTSAALAWVNFPGTEKLKKKIPYVAVYAVLSSCTIFFLSAFFCDVPCWVIHFFFVDVAIA